MSVVLSQSNLHLCSTNIFLVILCNCLHTVKRRRSLSETVEHFTVTDQYGPATCDNSTTWLLPKGIVTSITYFLRNNHPNNQCYIFTMYEGRIFRVPVSGLCVKGPSRTPLFSTCSRSFA